MSYLVSINKFANLSFLSGVLSSLVCPLAGCSGDPKPSGGEPRTAGSLPHAGAAGDSQPTGSVAPKGVTWPSGTDGLDPVFFSQFGEWRGLPATSSWINLHWLKWEWLTAPGLAATLDGTSSVRVWDMLEDWDGMAVLSMSMAGPDDMTQPEYDEAMRQCARGEFDDEWRTFARIATSSGRTGKNTVVSLAHEFNGTWFPWNPKTVGQETWTACWRNVYTAIKSASDLRVVWVMSASSITEKNDDYAVDNAWDSYPGDAYVDIIGINRYDFSMLGERGQTDWKKTCGNEQDLCDAADYARKHKKTIAVPEWSVERGEYGYGDNSTFIDFMYKFFADNRDLLAFENNFNNGGLGDWHLYPPTPDNEKSAARYKELW